MEIILKIAQKKCHEMWFPLAMSHRPKIIYTAFLKTAIPKTRMEVIIFLYKINRTNTLQIGDNIPVQVKKRSYIKG